MCGEGWGIQIPGVRISSLLVPFLSIATLHACSAEVPGAVCTESFAYVLVRAQTSAGPITGLTITDSVLRTGVRFTVPQNGIAVAGSYVILDDNFRGQVRSSGDSVQVTGYDGGNVFSAMYVFDVPDGCHVHKVSGPDVVP